MGRGRPHKCPYCGATKNVAKGFRYNKAGIVKLRRCLKCRRRWTAGVKPADQKSPDPTQISGEQGLMGSNSLKTETQPAPEQVDQERNIELPLSGEVGPSHDDPGRGKKDGLEL